MRVETQLTIADERGKNGPRKGEPFILRRFQVHLPARPVLPIRCVCVSISLATS